MTRPRVRRPDGRAVATALLDQGARVRMVNRSGSVVIAGVETVAGDATDLDFARGVTAGAGTVYFCLNAPNYHRWAEEFPPLQRAVLGAGAGGRREARRPREPLHVRPEPRPAP